VVDAFPTVAFNNIFTQQSNRLVGNLTFTRPLFRRQQILDGVLGAASLIEKCVIKTRRIG
jgi:hypothetical protein